MMLQKIKNIFRHPADSAKKRKVRTVESIVVMVCLAMLITTVSYAWVRRKWTPVISQDNMQIMSGESLVFALYGSNQTDIQGITPLNDLIDLADFVFRPVSNLSGRSEDFFALNTDDYLNETYVHLLPGGTVTPASYTRQGLERGYIEFTIRVTGRDPQAMETMPDYTKYVYLSEETKLTARTGDTSNCDLAFRISITMNNTDTVIISNRGSHSAITNARADDGTWLADGAKYRSDSNDSADYTTDYVGNKKAIRFVPSGATDPIPLVETASEVHSFSDFMGGYNERGEGTFDAGKTLFSVGPGATETLTIRVWLEGEDDACIGDIMGKLVNFTIGFRSYNIDNNAEETTVPEETTRVVTRPILD